MICENATRLFYIRWSGSQMRLLEFNIWLLPWRPFILPQRKWIHSKKKLFSIKGKQIVISVPASFCESDHVFTKGGLVCEEDLRAGIVPYHEHYLYIYKTENYLKYRCWGQSPFIFTINVSLYFAIQAESNCMIISGRYSARKVPVRKFWVHTVGT